MGKGNCINKTCYMALIISFYITLLFQYNFIPNYAMAQVVETQAKNSQYEQNRAELLNSIRGSVNTKDVVLNKQEELLNNKIISMRDELMKKYKESGKFPPAEMFFLNKAEIEQTELYALLKKMPKGGLLHLHVYATGRAQWIVNDVITRKDCYIYWNDDSKDFVRGQIAIFSEGNEPEGFVSAQSLKKTVPDFDKQLYSYLTFGPEDMECGDIWKEFENIFNRLDSYLNYKPVLVDYYTDAFETMLKDNIQYIELRGGFSKVRDESGKINTQDETIKLFANIRDNLRRKYPEFNLKLIYTAGSKTTPVEKVKERVKQARELYYRHPDLITGIDLVGEEDKGNQIYSIYTALLDIKPLNLYIHSGETDWPTNMNILDAVLLGSKRIGHGINLFYFPKLKEEMVKRNIAIELCPISNQLLGYVKDLRFHPGLRDMQKGIAVTLNSDDPMIFQTEGLSHDFWEALMAWNLDLKALKKLSRDSLVYSGMSEIEKAKALKIWQEKWDSFVNEACKNTK